MLHGVVELCAISDGQLMLFAQVVTRRPGFDVALPLLVYPVHPKLLRLSPTIRCQLSPKLLTELEYDLRKDFHNYSNNVQDKLR